MHRVDTATAAATLPAPQPQGTPSYFTQGDPAQGIPASVPGPDWFNMVQEELAAIVKAGGDTPDQNKKNNAQVATNIQSLIDNATNTVMSKHRFRGCMLRKIVAPSSPSVGATMVWAEAEYDTDNFFDPTKPTRLTISDPTIKKVSLRFSFGSTKHANFSDALILKNRSERYPGNVRSPITSTITQISGLAIPVVHGDYFECGVYGNVYGRLYPYPHSIFAEIMAVDS